MRILFLADRRFERHRFLRNLDDFAHFFNADAHRFRDLLRLRFAPLLLKQLAADANQLVDGFNHVHRDADRARLIGNRAGDGLTNPPRRIGREFEALCIVELFNRLDQAEVALLNQIEEEHAAADIALGDGDDQTQIRLGELLFRRLRHLAAHFHLLGDLDLFFRRQQRHLADFLEVHAHGVVNADAFRNGDVHVRARHIGGQHGGLILRRVNDVDPFGFQRFKHRVNRVRINIQIAELVHHVLIGQRFLFVARKVEDFLHLLLCLFLVQCH